MSGFGALRYGLTALLASLLVAASGCSGEGAGDVDDMDDADEGQSEDAVTVPAATGPLEFANACRPGTQITIAAVGDVLLHSGLQRQAYAAGDGHHSLWKAIEDKLALADLTYGNLEGPCADGHTASGTARDPGKVFDGQVYSSYPQFNYHPSLIDDLKASGFDVVSTANNHSLDRRGRGADRTIENLRAKGLPYTGTKMSSEMDAPWYAITEARGIRVAWIACTYGTNGIPDPRNQVLSCYEDRSTLVSNVRELAQRSDVDAVIVTPHWGAEYVHVPATQEKNLAHELLDAGALAVFGGHPHVVQPWERHVTPDGRETFVIYSLGNFVSGQTTIARQSSLVLYLGLTKGSDGKVWINGVRHLPIMMKKTPWTAVPATGEHLALTTRILGQWNRLEPDEDVLTNPSCSR